MQSSKLQDSVKYVQEFLEPRLTNHKTSLVKKEIPDYIDVCLNYNAREGKIINGRSFKSNYLNIKGIKYQTCIYDSNARFPWWKFFFLESRTVFSFEAWNPMVNWNS